MIFERGKLKTFQLNNKTSLEIFQEQRKFLLNGIKSEQTKEILFHFTNMLFRFYI